MRVALHVALGLMGASGVLWLALSVGVDQLARDVVVASAWLPILLALEGGRIACDAAATRALYRPSVAPWRALFHAHLLAYPATLLLPAGRAAGEALKAVVLVRHVGVERAAAAALLNQSLSLFAVFVVSLPCVLVAFTTLGPGVLSWAIATQTATAIVLGALIGVAARRHQIGGVLAALSRRLGAVTERVVGEVRRIGALPALPFAAHVANRALLVLQIALLAGALSVARGADALLVVGSYFVGSAAGDIVPAQLGATDGALALAAPTLGASVAQLVSLALLIHVTQLCWALAGVGVSLFGAARRR